jgi:hypothetical protein
MWSYRWARMRYNLNKRKRMDLSLIPKFPRGTFVNFVGRRDLQPMEVLGTEVNMHGNRIVNCHFLGDEWHFLEDELRTIDGMGKRLVHAPPHGRVDVRQDARMDGRAHSPVHADPVRWHRHYARLVGPLPYCDPGRVLVLHLAELQRADGMKITIEHHGRKYTAEVEEDISLSDFYDTLRTVVRCVWSEEQTAEIFNEERTAEGGPIHGVPDDYLLSGFGQPQAVQDAEGTEGRRKAKRT